ncbi:MAG: hypothetical protein MNSN_04630 [Minisyncoccus archaeiphilus]|uniref:hypothetical protein n=1 Tax=Minisyncoccus archaeiphilus TaxID=3238481 RepID=UPI002B07092E|nr:MAG: hypothetical protein MNSN_04630 [Candidatus Parcubacteria bacterium]
MNQISIRSKFLIANALLVAQLLVLFSTYEFHLIDIMVGRIASFILFLSIVIVVFQMSHWSDVKAE